MKIFVINLKKDINRRLQISQRLESLNLDYEIFEGTNGKELKANEINLIYQRYNSRKKRMRELTHGQIGCASSHLNLYMEILKRDLEMALILEDDAVLMDNFVEAMQLVNYLPKNWEIFLLGYSSSRDIPCHFRVHLPKEIYKFGVGVSPKKRGCLHGYIINQRGAKRMIEHGKKLYQPIDMYSADYRFMNTYIIFPRVVYQNKNFESSIGYDWENTEIPHWKNLKIVNKIRALNHKRKGRKKIIGLSLSCFKAKLIFLLTNKSRSYRD